MLQPDGQYLHNWLKPVTLVRGVVGTVFCASNTGCTVREGQRQQIRDVCPSLETDIVHCLSAGESLALFVGPVPTDKLPKDATAGRSLAGTLQLGLQQGSKQHAPGSFPLTYRSGLAPCRLPCFLHLPSAALHAKSLCDSHSSSVLSHAPLKNQVPAHRAWCSAWSVSTLCCSVAPKAKSDDVKATDEDAGQPSQEEKLREAVRDAEVKFLQVGKFPPVSLPVPGSSLSDTLCYSQHVPDSALLHSGASYLLLTPTHPWQLCY